MAKLSTFLAPHWRGHLFLFDSPKVAATAQAPAALVRNLVILVGVMELVIGPRLSILYRLGLPPLPLWLRTPLLLAVVLAILRFGFRLTLSFVGLRPWRMWTATEKSYAVQVFVIANVVFGTVFASRLSMLVQAPDGFAQLWLRIAPNFVWGVYQELIYRGILQTALVRQLGAASGILMANLLYTFGPLHFYHFSETPSPAFMFAAIFAIGLFFSVLFARSHNLWLVAMMHGIGTAYIVGTRPL